MHKPLACFYDYLLGTPLSEDLAKKRGPFANFFIEARSSKLLSIVNITSVVYCIVLVFTFVGVYDVMPAFIIFAHFFAISIIIANLFLLYKTENIPRSAGILLFCMLMIHLINISIVGGIDNPHFAWIFMFPILAGGTLGWRGQIFFYILCLLGTIYFAVFPDTVNILTQDDDVAYTFFTRFMSLTIFTLIMLIYYFTLNEKMEHLQRALKVASFESKLFLGVFNSKAQSVIMINNQGVIERANAKAHRTFEFKDLDGRNIKELCSQGLEQINEELDNADSVENTRGLESIEKHITLHKGGTLWVEYSIIRIVDENDKIHFLLTFEDISERKNYESKLSYLARYDYLTKLPNRLSIQEHLNEMIDVAKRNESAFAVAFFDLDRFKNVNDVQGHQAGDKVLREVAKRLQSQMKNNDYIGRFGGDEFVFMFDGIGPDDDAGQSVKAIQALLATPIKDAEAEYVVGSSVGLAFYPQDASSADDLIQKADIAMYKAKGKGRGNYQFYNADHDDDMKRQIRLGSELHFAIARNELTLLFQPMYNSDGDICAAEALVRWHHFDMGFVSPNEFIPLSEENGLIVPIGLWVLDQALCALKKWHLMGYDELVMSVNVSYRQINSDDLVFELRRLLDKHSLKGDSIILELTERVFADDLELVKYNIQEFADMGVQTAIDDFGVGYSSLSYLKETKFSALKIDRDFIKGIEDDESSRKLCSAISSMANDLGLSVTAEGVETDEQFEILKLMNIDKYQGFWKSKPIAMVDFERLLVGEKNEKDIKGSESLKSTT